MSNSAQPPPSSGHTDDTPTSNANDYQLLSEHYESFTEALELLYIPDNLGGRLKFLQQWPHAAHFIFGEELIGFDVNGTKDKQRRAALEDSAEERRFQLLEYATDVENKSVRGGALEKSYIQQTVEAIGRDLATCIYNPRVIDKVMPQAAPVATQAPAMPKQTQPPAPVLQVHAAVLENPAQNDPPQSPPPPAAPQEEPHEVVPDMAVVKPDLPPPAAPAKPKIAGPPPPSKPKGRIAGPPPPKPSKKRDGEPE